MRSLENIEQLGEKGKYRLENKHEGSIQCVDDMYGWSRSFRFERKSFEGTLPSFFFGGSDGIFDFKNTIFLLLPHVFLLTHLLTRKLYTSRKIGFLFAIFMRRTSEISTVA